MQPETIVALISAGLSAFVAATVPWMAFRFALRQEQVRWVREQKAQLYRDILVEAIAMRDWFNHHIIPKEQRSTVPFTDIGLPPLEQAQLAARSAIFASAEVNALYERLQLNVVKAVRLDVKDRTTWSLTHDTVHETVEQLAAVIRSEIGGTRLP